jgi:hypothetical protein
MDPASPKIIDTVAITVVGMLTLSTLATGFLVVDYVYLGFGHIDAQWQLPFVGYGIPAAVVSGVAALVLVLSGRWRKLSLSVWALIACVLPIALIVSLREYGLPHWYR